MLHRIGQFVLIGTAAIQPESEASIALDAPYNMHSPRQQVCAHEARAEVSDVVLFVELRRTMIDQVCELLVPEWPPIVLEREFAVGNTN